jgi:hypothetical protein
VADHTCAFTVWARKQIHTSIIKPTFFFISFSFLAVFRIVLPYYKIKYIDSMIVDQFLNGMFPLADLELGFFSPRNTIPEKYLLEIFFVSNYIANDR